MTQSQFEQELIRAIEHGCPFCKCNFAHVIKRWEQTQLAYIDGTGLLRWDAVEGRFLLEEPKLVYCAENPCQEIWYQYPDGWIPELQEIVKGE